MYIYIILRGHNSIIIIENYHRRTTLNAIIILNIIKILQMYT